MREPRIEVPFGEIDEMAERLLGRNTIAVAVVSMHGKESGQWILCNPRHDKKLIAERLRLCANLLDPVCVLQA